MFCVAITTSNDLHSSALYEYASYTSHVFGSTFTCVVLVRRTPVPPRALESLEKARTGMGGTVGFLGSHRHVRVRAGVRPSSSIMSSISSSFIHCQFIDSACIGRQWLVICDRQPRTFILRDGVHPHSLLLSLSDSTHPLICSMWCHTIWS